MIKMAPRQRRSGSSPDRRPSRTASRFVVPLLVVAAAGTLAWLERRRPLRQRIEPQSEHVSRNIVLFATSAATVSALQRPFLQRITRFVERERFGLVQALPLPRTARRVLAVLLLDYTLWWWHRLNHRVPFLWRFHLVHHIDRDLDTSTAMRFHFGEMAMSVPYRLLQVLTIGADETALTTWQTLLLLSILFHHSNVDLGDSTDASLARFVVTPRMHGIHHSDVLAETDSNWSSTTSLWDALHGTLRLDVPQESITIGVRAYRAPEDVTVGRSLALPFGKQRQDWGRAGVSS